MCVRSSSRRSRKTIARTGRSSCSTSISSRSIPLCCARCGICWENQDWITTAPQTSDPYTLGTFDAKPLLVLTEDADIQEQVFFRDNSRRRAPARLRIGPHREDRHQDAARAPASGGDASAGTASQRASHQLPPLVEQRMGRSGRRRTDEGRRLDASERGAAAGASGPCAPSGLLDSLLYPGWIRASR